MNKMMPVWLVLLPLMLSSCMSVQEGTSIREEALKHGLTIVRALPRSLPAAARAVPRTQYVLVKADSEKPSALPFAAPLPFAGDIAADAANKREPGQYAAHYSSLDPYTIAVAGLQGSLLLSPRGDALRLVPLVYVLESADDRFRFTQVFRVEGSGWAARYLYHLPTSYSAEQIINPQAQELENLRRELVAGAGILRGLMERDAKGELMADGSKVDVDSDFLVGGKGMGGELLQETPDHVVLRSRGGGKSNVSGLIYGVHYFYKDQLSAFKKQPVEKQD